MNLKRGWKQPPVVILQESTFYNIFIRCLWLKIITKSSQGVYFMSFPSQIFFNKISHGYRAAILKKSFFDCFLLIWLWLFIAIMKRWAEQCAIVLYLLNICCWVHIRSCENCDCFLSSKDYGVKNQRN